MKSQSLPELKPSPSLFVSKNPCYIISVLILHRKDFSSSAITQCRQLISHDNAHAAELTSRMRVKSLSTRAPSSRATCQVTDFNQTLPV